MIHTIGIDVGSGAIKSVLFRHDEDAHPVWVAKRCERIRSRDPMTLARQGYEGVLADAGLEKKEKETREKNKKKRKIGQKKNKDTSRIVAMSFCEPRSCIGRLSS